MKVNGHSALLTVFLHRGLERFLVHPENLQAPGIVLQSVMINVRARLSATSEICMSTVKTQFQNPQVRCELYSRKHIQTVHHYAAHQKARHTLFVAVAEVPASACELKCSVSFPPSVPRPYPAQQTPVFQTVHLYAAHQKARHTIFVAVAEVPASECELKCSVSFPPGVPLPYPAQQTPVFGRV